MRLISLTEFQELLNWGILMGVCHCVVLLLHGYALLLSGVNRFLQSFPSIQLFNSESAACTCVMSNSFGNFALLVRMHTIFMITYDVWLSVCCHSYMLSLLASAYASKGHLSAG